MTVRDVKEISLHAAAVSSSLHASRLKALSNPNLSRALCFPVDAGAGRNIGGLTDGGKDDASRLVSKIVTEQRTGSEVANWLFGTAGVGQAGVSSRVAAQIKNHLGANSPEWQALRHAAWDKMTNPARGEGGAAKVRSMIDFIRGSGAPLANELFSPAELAQMTRLAGVIRSTITDARATNRGQSGYEIARMMSGKAGLGAAAAGVGAAIWQQDPKYLALAALPLLRSGSSLSKGLAATRAQPSAFATGTGTAARILNLTGAQEVGRR